MSFSCFLLAVFMVASVVAIDSTAESGDLPNWFTNAFPDFAEQSEKYSWLPCDSVSLQWNNGKSVTCSEGLIVEFVDESFVVANPTSCPTYCDSEDTCNSFAESLSSEDHFPEIVVLPATAQDAFAAAAGELPVKFFIKDQFYVNYSLQGPPTFGSAYATNDI